ncbi:phage tail protein [Bradyrhizobium tropiciagri]|nr:phage tail protein [Bradyrhizobium tropiciagri]
MSEPFLSEIRMMSFNFPPKGWAMCNGQILPVNQNQALFSLLGDVYGGNGQTTFGLPNLQGRVPIHTGSGFELGQHSGEQGHTLTTAEMPKHSHLVNVTNSNGTVPTNAGGWLGAFNNGYTPPANPTTSLRPETISIVGGNQAHNNMQPYLTINFSIALQGIFPSQN